jgi:hypothetical protein
MISRLLLAMLRGYQRWVSPMRQKPLPCMAAFMDVGWQCGGCCAASPLVVQGMILCRPNSES